MTPKPRGVIAAGWFKDMRTVIFHALLPTGPWMWDDEQSEVYIRFGDGALGKWEHDFGPMMKNRYIDYDCHTDFHSQLWVKLMSWIAIIVCIK